MATKSRFIIQNNTGGRRPDYYDDLEAAIAEAETLNGGVSVPENDGYVVVAVFVGDWAY